MYYFDDGKETFYVNLQSKNVTLRYGTTEGAVLGSPQQFMSYQFL